MKKRQKKILQQQIDEAKKLAGNGLIVLGSNASIGACELCGAKDEELRPYGPNGENICFDCGMKDRDTTEKQMGKFLNFGE
jgi:hypothetical protein